AIVHDHQQAIALVEYGIADAAGQAVVPEASVAHEANGALIRFRRIERRRARPAKAVTHRRCADVEGRENRKQVTTNVATDMMRAELPLHQFHRGEDWALRTARAERRRARMHLFLQRRQKL